MLWDHFDLQMRSAYATGVGDATEVPNAYISLTNRKTAFLDGLRGWTDGKDANNTFVAIYSHMGADGLSPDQRNEVVTWQDLKGALGKVHTLWLIGCESAHVMNVWPSPAVSPVSGTMLVTSETENWLDLVKVFGHEIDLSAVRFFDEVETVVRSLLPKLGHAIHYFDASDPGCWKKFAPRSSAEAPAGVETFDPSEVAQILWGDWNDEVHKENE